MQRLDKAQKANNSDDHKLPKKNFYDRKSALSLLSLRSLPSDSLFISVSADISKDHLPAMKDF